MTEDGEFEVGDTVRCIKQSPKGAYQIEVGAVIQIDYVSSSVIKPDRTADACYMMGLFELVQSFGTRRLLKRRGMNASQTDL